MIGLTSVFSDFIGTAQKIYQRTPKLAAHLPGLFHDQAVKTSSPLWALLLLMEDNFVSISRVVDQIDQYVDMRRAPDGNTPGDPDFIAWLGTWVSQIPRHNWPESKRRYVLGIAADLHKYRGTLTGLRYMLALFFEIDVKIEEWTWPEAMQTGLHNTIGLDTRIDGRYNINHCFTVTWTPTPRDSGPELQQKIADIRALIDREKPAHTWCYFNVEGHEPGGEAQKTEAQNGENHR